jgi:glycosyltransferase involved in cell wall biosynthesis
MAGPRRPTPRLSILIPTLVARRRSLDELLAILEPQAHEGVEVLVSADSGQMSIGQKRNGLLRQARGDFVAFVDDDDRVPGDYADRLLRALESEPDCASLTGRIVFADGYSRPFVHSLRYDRWIDDHRRKIYYRPPNHLNAIRRGLALRVGFPPISFGEDRYFSMGMVRLLRREAWVDGVLYEYRCRQTFEETHGPSVAR